MGYNINFGMWGSIFAVPTELIDNEIKLCTEIQLKVLLLALRYSQSSIDTKQIASTLVCSEDKVVSALNFWHTKGIFKQTDVQPKIVQEEWQPEPPILHDLPASEALPAPQPDIKLVPPTPAVRDITADETAPVPQPTIKQADAPTSQMIISGQKIVTVHGHNKLTPAQVNDYFETDVTMLRVASEVQKATGNTLAQPQIESLVYLCLHYDLDAAFLLIVLEFCVQITEDMHFNYYEKVLKQWLANGIRTYELAEEHILKSKKVYEQETAIKALLGRLNDNFAARERKAIAVWFDDYNFDITIITHAHKQIIQLWGESDINAISKTLSKWHGADVTTIEQANRCGLPSIKKSAKNAGNPNAYDINELYEIMDNNLDLYLNEG